MKKMKIALIMLVLSFHTGYLFALDFYSHPETAEKNAIFLNISIFRWHIPSDYDVPVFNASFDYMLPVFLPFSLGVFFDRPNPVVGGFGPRLAYHLDLDEEKLDFYIFYTFDFGFLRNDALCQNGLPEIQPRYDDIRAGLRFIYNAFFGLYMETGYMLSYIEIGVTLKLN